MLKDLGSLLKEFYFEVSKGNISNHECFHSLGERQNIEVIVQGVDAWTGDSYQIPLPDQVNGEQMTVVSTSPDDTSAGSGVRKIDLHYLDKNGDRHEVEIILAGTTPVDTIATDIRFVQHLHAIEVGSNGVAEGDITIYRKTDSSRVYSEIQIGGNMALCNHRMIPNGYTYYIFEWSASATGTKRVAIRLRSTDEHSVVRPGTFLFKDTCNLLDSSYMRRFVIPVEIPALSIVKTSMWVAPGGQGAYVSSSFRGILVKNA